MTTAVLLESPDSVRQFRTLLARGQYREAQIVALSPWAEYLLQVEGQPFVTPDDCCRFSDVNAIGMRNFQLVQECIRVIDAHLQARCSGITDTSFGPCSCYFFPLKVMFDSVTTRIFQLQAVAAGLRARTLLYFDTPREDPPTGLDFRNESIYSALVPLWAESTAAEAQCLGSAQFQFPRVADSSPLQSAAARRVQQVGRLLRAIALRRFAIDPAKTKKLVVLDSGLAWHMLAATRHEIVLWDVNRAYTTNIARWPLPKRVETTQGHVLAQLVQACASAWAEADALPKFRSLFQAGGIDFYGLVRRRLEMLAAKLAPATLASYLGARRTLTKMRPSALVAKSLAGPAQRTVAEAARSSSLPAIVHDHGAAGYFDFPMFRYLDAAVADYRLVWGEGVKRYIETTSEGRARPLAVGHIELDALLQRTADQRKVRRQQLCKRFRLNPGRPIVVYPLSVLFGNSGYLPHVVLSDSEYFAHQCRIAHIFHDFPEIQCVIKLHPNPNFPRSPIAEYVRDQRIENCSCVSGPALSEMLDLADLFINDSPTTTLLEMLTTPTRILVLEDGVMRFTPEARELLPQQIVLTQSIAELEVTLRDHLAHRKFDPILSADTRFLGEYGSLYPGVSSSERTVEALSQILLSV